MARAERVVAEREREMAELWWTVGEATDEERRWTAIASLATARLATAPANAGVSTREVL